MATLDSLLKLALFLDSSLSRGPSFLSLCNPCLNGFWGVQDDIGTLYGYWFSTETLGLDRPVETALEKEGSPFEAGIGIPFWLFFTLVPSGRVYEVSVHHVYFNRLLRSGESTPMVGASAVSRLVPAPELPRLVGNRSRIT